MKPDNVTQSERADLAEDMMVSIPRPGHGLGKVSNDWEAAEKAIRARKRKGNTGKSAETIATYHFHLDKVRWYCENISRTTLSRWTIDDVDAFTTFLESVPIEHLCQRIDGIGSRFARKGETGWTPFQIQPSPSSQIDTLRFLHSIFNIWSRVDYIRIDPMALSAPPAPKRLKTERSIDLTIFDYIIAYLNQMETPDANALRYQARDLFAFQALVGLGLRASEFVLGNMGAFQLTTPPGSDSAFWIFNVAPETSKGSKQRSIPVPRILLDALQRYRSAFKLSPMPAPFDETPLLLSPRTRNSTATGFTTHKSTKERRYFEMWGAINTRDGLLKLVKRRILETIIWLEGNEKQDLAQHLRLVSTHWLRHTFGKARVRAGEHMRSVSALLGHADPATTMHYTEQNAWDAIAERLKVEPDTLATE